MRRIGQRCISRCFQMGRKTAAALMIGDEILIGSTLDTNSHFLATFLNTHGVQLSEIRTIPDTIEGISRHLSDLRQAEFDYIFTSGGIGSTHDDVTYEAIAECFGVPLELHEETARRIHEFVPEERINDSMMRMAHLPAGVECFYLDKYFAPIARIDNVFIGPGIPYMFTHLIENMADEFHDPSGLIHSKILYSKVGETQFAAPLAEIASRYPDLVIGSYPTMRRVGEPAKSNSDYTVKVVAKGLVSQSDLLDECMSEIQVVVKGWFDEDEDSQN